MTVLKRASKQKKKKALVIISIDYKKAFNSIKRGELIEALL